MGPNFRNYFIFQTIYTEGVLYFLEQSPLLE